MKDCDALSRHMKDVGLDVSWWKNVCLGTQDPWIKLRENDPNEQVKSWKIQYK